MSNILKIPYFLGGGGRYACHSERSEESDFVILRLV